MWIGEVGHSVFSVDTDHFLELAPGTGIYYEEGANDLAGELGKHTQTAIETAVLAQGSAFPKPVRFYALVNSGSFSKYSGASGRARGAVFNEKLFISPRAMETKTIPGILAHELSHLHFQQHIGNSRYASNVPPWFQEGLAVYVSNGGGAESVTIEDATANILRGKSIQPNDSGSLFLPKQHLPLV